MLVSINVLLQKKKKTIVDIDSRHDHHHDHHHHRDNKLPERENVSHTLFMTERSESTLPPRLHGYNKALERLNLSRKAKNNDKGKIINSFRPVSSNALRIAVETRAAVPVIIPPKPTLPVDISFVSRTLPNMTALFRYRLGNQMFQYAAIYCIARDLGYNPVIKADNMVLAAFPRLRTLVETSDNKNFQSSFKEVGDMMFDNRTATLKEKKGADTNVILWGAYQSWKYFKHRWEDMRDQFGFLTETEDKVMLHLRNLTSHHQHVGADGEDITAPYFISIHVRRGDFVSLKEIGYHVSSIEYIMKAMAFFEAKRKNIVFVVCSNDQVWCKANIRSKQSAVVFSPFTDPVSDLCLMSHGNATIMTTGTFGWWGGWMAGGDVVYDKGFPIPGSILAKSFVSEDFFPSHWVGMS